MKIEWKDEYITGKTEIDDQNKWLIELFNKLAAAAEDNIQNPDIQKYVDELEEFANLQFWYEDKILKKLPVEIYNEHKNEHNDFEYIIKQLRHEIYDHGDISSLYQIILYLSEWLLNHVRYSDKYHLINRD